jgi:hypothetical protein
VTATTIDPKAAYEAAAATHRRLCREYGEAAGKASRAKHQVTAVRESGLGDLAAAQQRFQRADAERQRLRVACDEADETAAQARAALIGKLAPTPRTRPAVTPAPVPAPLPAVSELQAAIGAGRVYTRDYHEHTLAVAVENEQRRAAAMEYRLRGLLELAHGDLVARVVAAINQVPAGSSGLKHTGDCWQRHASCLADRIRALLDGRPVA